MSRNTQYTSGQDLEADWDNLAENMDMSLGDGGFLNEPLIVGPSGTGFHGLTPALPMGDPFSQELISLGVQEPLPPEGVMDDLYVPYNFYFLHIKYQVLATTPHYDVYLLGPLSENTFGFYRQNWPLSLKALCSYIKSVFMQPSDKLCSSLYVLMASFLRSR